MHFLPVFQKKMVKINPDSFFWWKIVKICHTASPKWIKIVDFRGFLCFRVENLGLRVEILKMRFLKKGSTKNFKKYGKQTTRWYIFMGCRSWPWAKKKLILPQKPTVCSWLGWMPTLCCSWLGWKPTLCCCWLGVLSWNPTLRCRGHCCRWLGGFSWQSQTNT